MDLANDLFNATVYIIGPKCEWVLSSLINEDYNANNCYSIDNIKNFTFANCKSDLKFEWFWDNIVFFVQYYYPSALEWLRNAPFPFTLLFNIEPFEEILNKFINVNWQDEIPYSQYMACGWGYTLIPNYVIFNTLLVTVYGIASPATFAAFLSILLPLFWMFILFIQLFSYLIISLRYYPYRTAYVKAGLIDENASLAPPPDTESVGIEIDGETFITGEQFGSLSGAYDTNNTQKKKKKKKSALSVIKSAITYLSAMIKFYLYACYHAVVPLKNKKRKRS
jgi:hypothetical protein